MDPFHPDDLRADLHQLVDRLCDAPPAERKALLTRLIRSSRLFLQLQAYQELRAKPSPATETATPPVLEGAFVRLLAGGKLLTATGEHLMTEADVAAARLQHGDFVSATWQDEVSGYSYRALQGPLVDQTAVHALGHLEPLDADLALVRTLQHEEVTVSVLDMSARGATVGDVLKVAYLPELGQYGRHLGRILQVYYTGSEPVSTQPAASALERSATSRRRRSADRPSDQPKGPLPQFQVTATGRRLRVVVVGGHHSARAKFDQIMADYGAELHWLPYSPKAKVVRHAVQACDIVIGMPHCCRTGHWESAVENSRAFGKLLFYGESDRECGLRRQLEQVIIPKWNERVTAEPLAT